MPKCNVYDTLKLALGAGGGENYQNRYNLKINNCKI
jgi:hypothetical protein